LVGTGGFSGWMLHTYKRIRFLLIVGVVLALVLWYFNSVLFYNVVYSGVDFASATGSVVKDFVGGF